MWLLCLVGVWVTSLVLADTPHNRTGTGTEALETIRYLPPDHLENPDDNAHQDTPPLTQLMMANDPAARILDFRFGGFTNRVDGRVSPIWYGRVPANGRFYGVHNLSNDDPNLYKYPENGLMLEPSVSMDADVGVGVGVDMYGVVGECRNWCKTYLPRVYCCDAPLADVLKPGHCPPLRSSCPVLGHYLPPSTCSDDGSCPGVDKCCYDNCLQQHTCSSPHGLLR